MTYSLMDIYQQYQIPPNLIRHQLEVAAVGRYVCLHWSGKPIDADLITQVLLLHDMGNIIKFKRPFLSKELHNDLAHWEQIQDAFIQKYGSDVHTATVQIVDGLPVSDAVKALIAQLDGEYLERNGYGSDELYVANYADMCVSPEGIVGFQKRFLDLQTRYGMEAIEKYRNRLEGNNEYVQSYVDVDLTSIENIDFKQEIENLRHYSF